MQPITLGSVPRRLQDLVDRELAPGERIEWIDTPAAKFFTPASLGAFLFGIPWTAFAIFWTCGAAGFDWPDFSEGGFSFFPLFGVPFILIGLGMLSSPLWARRNARKTVYAITDERAIIFQGGWSTTIRSFTPTQLQNIYRTERRDGSGDVVFHAEPWRDSDGDRHATPVGFLRVRDVRAVEDRLKELAKTHSPAAG